MGLQEDRRTAARRKQEQKIQRTKQDQRNQRTKQDQRNQRTKQSQKNQRANWPKCQKARPEEPMARQQQRPAPHLPVEQYAFRRLLQHGEQTDPWGPQPSWRDDAWPSWTSAPSEGWLLPPTAEQKKKEWETEGKSPFLLHLARCSEFLSERETEGKAPFLS
jgi:hypothetical protein